MTATLPLGSKILTVGRFGQKMARVGNMCFPVWSAKVFEVTARKRDGKPIYRLVSCVGNTVSGRCVSDKFLATAKEYAAQEGLPFVSAVNHFDPVNPI